MSDGDGVRTIDTGVPPARFARGWHCLGLASSFRDPGPHAVAAFGTKLVVFADSAGGVALGALVELRRTGQIREDEQVVLVVTGSGLKPYGYDVPVSREEIPADVNAVLRALGIG